MTGKINKAMVLAAGYGTRLKPLTDALPKPLVPVAGRPMIDYALDKLQGYGAGEVVINVSHLKEQLVAHLAARNKLGGGASQSRIKISEEPEPLETGGGLKNAQPLLGCEPVFVINSDIIWTDEGDVLTWSARTRPRFGTTRHVASGESGVEPPQSKSQHDKGETALERLTRHWDGDKMDFLLLAQSKSRAVGHDKGEDHLFIKRENTLGWNERDAPYIIAGIGIFHPRVLRHAPGGKFSVKILWHQALAQNRLFCLPHLGRWFQTGTLEDIRKAELELKAM